MEHSTPEEIEDDWTPSKGRSNYCDGHEDLTHVVKRIEKAIYGNGGKQGMEEDVRGPLGLIHAVNKLNSEMKTQNKLLYGILLGVAVSAIGVIWGH